MSNIFEINIIINDVKQKFVNKLEEFRLKFEKQEGYMAVEFFEDVMKYKKELEEKLE